VLVLALGVGLAAAAGCRRATEVGSLACRTSGECTPPSTVCGPDGRCVAGCLSDPTLCLEGASCDPTSGECAGGSSCTDDDDCDPPAAVCNLLSHACVAGCTLAGCAAGFNCNPSSGRCCDPSSVGCPRVADGGANCNSDSECVGAPANVCSGGACVPGCTSGAGCTAPLSCDPTTGHCSTPMCQRDLDCDPGSYCTQAATCAVLAYGGPVACAGGTKVPFDCATKKTPSDFMSCVGAAGPSGCPYCIDDSCFHPGMCASDTDCHRGDTCVGGLCRVTQPACPSEVSLSSVLQGSWAAGKEICVRGQVMLVRTGYDGMLEVRLGDTPYLYVDIMPLYQAAGVRLPKVGETVIVHGVVRWDAGHNDRELLPVDWVSDPQ
jgi:hypothetical protein